MKTESMQKPNLYKFYEIDNKELSVLLFLYPALTCLAFWYNVFTNSTIDPGSYFNLIMIVYVYRMSIQIESSYIPISVIALILTSFFCSMYFSIDLKQSFLYLVNLSNIIYYLYIIPKIDFSKVKPDLLKRHLSIFSLVFVVIYEISSHYARTHVNESDAFFDVVREYKEGFVISHFATYYLGALGLMLFLLKSRYLALGLWFYSFSLGARIGIVYIALAIAIIILVNFKFIHDYIYKFRYIVLLLIGVVITAIAQRIIALQGVEALMVYTSGRSVFWIFAINDILTDGLNVANLIGRGPGSTIMLNMSKLGAKIWMHNDFIEIMYTFGVVGLSVYLSSFIIYFKKVRSIYLFLVFFLSAFFNGFMTYDPLFIIVINTLVYQIYIRRAGLELK